MRGKGQQHPIHEYNVLEVVDYALSVEEVHRRPKEIPIERPRKGKILCAARDMRDGDYLLEGNNLEGRNNANHVDVS